MEPSGLQPRDVQHIAQDRHPRPIDTSPPLDEPSPLKRSSSHPVVGIDGQLGFDMTEEHKQVAVVYGYDLDGRRVYAWAANGQSRCWRLRGLLAHRGELMALDILRAFYPDAPDPTTLQARSVILLPAEGTAGERLPGSPSLIR